MEFNQLFSFSYIRTENSKTESFAQKKIENCYLPPDSKKQKKLMIQINKNLETGKQLTKKESGLMREFEN